VILHHDETFCIEKKIVEIVCQLNKIVSYMANYIVLLILNI